MILLNFNVDVYLSLRSYAEDVILVCYIGKKKKSLKP
jgi:hypothetical protein